MAQYWFLTGPRIVEITGLSLPRVTFTALALFKSDSDFDLVKNHLVDVVALAR